MQTAFGAASIVIETGPSIARQLYTPLTIDELWLSIFEGAEIPTAARGGRQVPPDQLRRWFDTAAAPLSVASADGPWRFMRLIRR